MRVVALISGGKDSCYNMVQCVMAGHQIVALANLKPESKESKDELDSYMYQTVGHQGIELYAEALNIRLFRQPTLGVALQNDKLYTPTPEDEVEDLYQLLCNIKEEIDFDAVSVGAVLSDYQRLRVENVCSRLGLVSLAYLWRRDQGELLQEMIDSNIEAIIIKVAALGLDPEKHLGLTISEIQPHLTKMVREQAYERQGKLRDDFETVIHSNDGIAPVGYLNFKRLRLVPKEGISADSTLWERLNRCQVLKTADDYITDIDQAEVTDTESDGGDGDHNGHQEVQSEREVVEIRETEPTPCRPSVSGTGSGWLWIGGIVGESEDLAEATTQALRKLQGVLAERDLTVAHLVRVILYVKDMSKFNEINSSYLEVIPGPNPPVRVCVGTGLNEASPVVISAVAYAHEKHVMHVQSLSHWAPANIGPYSQAVRVGDIIYVAGQIGLVPGSLEVVEGGVRRQCRLALRHVGRLVKAMDKETQLRDVVQGICYVTQPSHIGEARKEWERRTNNAIVEYVVVPQLPRGALIEWQVWAHRGNTRFEYEETGCVVGENRVSIKRRWNYENTVCGVVCYVSMASSVSNPVLSSAEGRLRGGDDETGWDSLLSEGQLSEVLCYALERLFRGLPPPEGGGERPPPAGLPLPGPCTLLIFYKSGRSPPPLAALRLISSLSNYSVAASLVPVSQLNHPNTFMSIVAARHE